MHFLSCFGMRVIEWFQYCVCYYWSRPDFIAKVAICNVTNVYVNNYIMLGLVMLG